MAAEVKPRNNRLLMVLGIVIAVLAFVLVVLFGGGKGSSEAARTQDVVVAAVDIPAGQQISDAIVHTVKFAPDQVPQGAIAASKTAVGQYAAVALPKNTVLSNSNLVPTVSTIKPAAKPYLDIPKGQVAIAIPAGGELQAVGGYLQQDDRIDILYNPSGSSKNTWKVTYQNLKIARLGPSTGATSANSQQQQTGTASSMIVYVSVDDAENLSELFSSGNYKLVLRSQQDINDNNTVSTAGATSDSFQAKFNVPK